MKKKTKAVRKERKKIDRYKRQQIICCQPSWGLPRGGWNRVCCKTPWDSQGKAMNYEGIRKDTHTEREWERGRELHCVSWVAEARPKIKGKLILRNCMKWVNEAWKTRPPNGLADCCLLHHHLSPLLKPQPLGRSILKILGKLINVKCLLIVSKSPSMSPMLTTQIDKRADRPSIRSPAGRRRLTARD